MEQERKEFEQRFSNDTKEIIALISECGGAGRSGGKKLWQAYAQILAYKDNGELIDEKKRLVWLLTDKENKKKGKIHKLEKNKIYRLLVKESLSYVHPISSQVIPEGKEMTIIKVLKRDIHDVS